jgi:hypothetical protein
MKAAIVELDAGINSKVNTPMETVFPLPPKDFFNSEDAELTEPIDEGKASLELQDPAPAKLDEYLSAQHLLPVGGERVPAMVLKRKLDSDDNPIGKHSSNPKLDTHKYDSMMFSYHADQLTHLLLILLSRISVHKLMQRVGLTLSSKTLSTTVVTAKSLRTIHTSINMDKLNHTYQLLIGKWRFNGLLVLKDSKPIKTSDYAISNKLADEPAFEWWAWDTVRSHDRFISKVKT